VFRTGDKVDLYYYTEARRPHAITGRIEYLGPVGVTLLTASGDLQFFPWSSVQRVILSEASRS
jgi:hypothetical protein